MAIYDKDIVNINRLPEKCPSRASCNIISGEAGARPYRGMKLTYFAASMSNAIENIDGGIAEACIIEILWQ